MALFYECMLKYPSNTLSGLQLSRLLNFLPMVAALADSEHSHALLCAICEKPCDSETCKADWNGLAVHEECLAEKLARQKAVQILATHS
jgi:hypothetical protein